MGGEHLVYPRFTRQPCHHTGLNGRIVRHGKRIAVAGYQHRADELGKRVRQAAEAQVQRLPRPVRISFAQPQ